MTHVKCELYLRTADDKSKLWNVDCSVPVEL